MGHQLLAAVGVCVCVSPQLRAREKRRASQLAAVDGEQTFGGARMGTGNARVRLGWNKPSSLDSETALADVCPRRFKYECNLADRQ